jgi:hypothetical protein
MTGILGGVAAAAPAGGAEIGQVVIATAGATIGTALLLWLGLAHRGGRSMVLSKAGAFAERVSGLPAWAALPGGVANVGLLTAVFGMYWDIALHIDNGRDAGPLANPAHYFILVGLFLIFAAGWLSICLPTEKPGGAAIKITRDWHAPVGGVLLMACSTFALVGFPLDDVWHRLFGQDVTLWGPTHMMLIGGAGMSLVGIMVLLVEGHGARKGRTAAEHEDAADTDGDAPKPAIGGPLALLSLRTVRMIAAAGGLLIGLSTFQGEFDFGVPQFRLAFEPVLLAIAGGIGLVVARTLIGRGAAFGAVVFFWIVRGLLALVVGGVFDQTTPHLPLYFGMALVVELAAVLAKPGSYRYGAIAGGLVGSLGLLSEYAWSHVAMPVEWPSRFLPEAIAVGLPTGVAAGLIGAFAGSALRLRGEAFATRSGWAPAAAALLFLVAMLGFVAPTNVPKDVRAAVTLAPAGAGHVKPTVRYTPQGAVRDADWLDAIAWQGGGKRTLTTLERQADGSYTTDQALPVGGSWKTLLRYHRGREMGVVPVFMPADAAIPGATEIPAARQFTRPLVSDKSVLQRERKTDVAGWLWGAMSLVVASLSFLLLATLGWGLVRLARHAGADSDDNADMKESDQWRFSKTPPASSPTAV